MISGVGTKTRDRQGQSEWKKVCRPEGWEEQIEGVKQACWCGEEWCDNHEDGNHEDVYVEMPVLGKRKAEEMKEADVEQDDESGSDESEEELEEGWEHGWYGPVRSQSWLDEQETHSQHDDRE